VNQDRQGRVPEVWSVGRILRWCEDDFRQHGSTTARLDAELLLARALGCTRIRLYVDWNKTLEPRELASLRELVARRRKGEPAAYILGEREFWSLTFKVDRRVLIPRPETEHVVEAVLDFVAGKALTQPRIADIGTGSGNIACALAKSLPTATILASDVSREAVDVAEENARSLGFTGRIECVQGDLIEPLRTRGAFDVLVSNPPYVTPDEWREISESIRAYEPAVALCDRAPDGLDTVRRLLREAPAVLAQPGAVIFEIGGGQGAGAEQAARAAGYADVTVRKDLAGRPRVVVAARA
jgi:release factor glutamine methyltransferase